VGRLSSRLMINRFRHTYHRTGHKNHFGRRRFSRIRRKNPLGRIFGFPKRGLSSSSGYAKMPQSKTCRICGQDTNEGKPYCLDHVEHQPYINKLMSRWSKKGAEEEAVGRSGPDAISENSLTSGEIIGYLRFHGTKTVEGISRGLNIKPETIHIYVKRLQNRGKVSLSRSIRGNTLVALANNRRHGKRRRYRRNPDYSMRKLPSPKSGQSFLSRLKRSNTPLFPVEKYVDLNATPGEVFLPAVLPSGRHTISRYGSIALPKGAANFLLLSEGKSPFIITPQGAEWKYKEEISAKLYDLIMNLDDIGSWEDLWVKCGGLQGLGCSAGSFEIYLVSRHNERYKLINVSMDYGDESGVLGVRHIGPKGVKILRVPQDVYEYSETPDGGVARVPYFLPIIVYKN